MTVEVDIWSHSEENSGLVASGPQTCTNGGKWWHVDTDVQGLLTTCRRIATSKSDDMLGGPRRRAGLGVNKRFLRYLANNFHFLQYISRLVH